MPEPGVGALITNAAPGIVGSHDVILQSLDNWKVHDHGDGNTDLLFYSSDKFRGTERAWESVPVILGKRHPTTPYSVNPDKALQEAEGVVVGTLADVYITNSGSPLLRSKLHFTDGYAESLSKTGKLALSSGFVTGVTEGYITGLNGGPILPDHVLAFSHSKVNRPQDQAALILNSTQEGTMPEDDTIRKALSDFLAELKSLIVPAKADPVMPIVPEPGGLVANMTDQKITDLEKTVSDQAELIKNMTAELETFKKADETRKAAEIDAKWSLVKNSTSPGLYATPELEKVHRDEWTKDPTAFLLKNAIAAKQEETSPDGVKFVKNAAGSQSEADAEYLKFIHGDV